MVQGSLMTFREGDSRGVGRQAVAAARFSQFNQSQSLCLRALALSILGPSAVDVNGIESSDVATMARKCQLLDWQDTLCPEMALFSQ